MGVAHHAAYVPWLEIGRTELLRTSGISYAQLEAEGVFLVIVKLEMSYRRPILYDDVIEVRTRVAKAGRVKIEHEYDLVLLERSQASQTGRSASMSSASSIGDTVASGRTVLASVATDGQVRELPDWLVGGV